MIKFSFDNNLEIVYLKIKKKKVGKETINNSDDVILKQDMPVSLRRVETASKSLEEACEVFKLDPFSQPGRVKLIEGARGILGRKE